MDRSDPNVPGVSTDPTLVAALAELLAAKGDDYEPRTEHLEPDGSPTFTNRLIGETSPYLLQHAHNPVNWRAWGEEAFERARDTDRPILLSVGYSTCHWCHVMEKESFEDLEIATYINEHFIPIKVDREERPDVDDLYMTAVQVLTGRGGWPMTIVMTPHGEPFFGGTYFPPRDGVRGARRGFLSVLTELVRRYRDEPGNVVAEAQQLSQRIQSITAPQPPGDVPNARAVAATTAAIARSYDPRHGGFGRAPKFPQPSRLGLMMRYQRRSEDPRALEMSVHTLDSMANGGMYDHVGGGFHRYSTDARWLVPHFEKMLYDNAQLAVAYLEGFQLGGHPRHRRIVTEVLDYVALEMRAPGGAFYSATDADSPNPDQGGEREEGWFFTWTPDELDELLGSSAPHLRAYWDVSDRGNFEGRNILWTPRPAAEVAQERGVSEADLFAMVAEARPVLHARRATRPPPLRDDKILTAWSGLMIGAFARAALVLDRDDYETVAIEAAEFLLETLRDDEGRLMRSWLGQPRHRAYLEDYAFLIEGLLDLHETTGDVRWVREAIELQTELDAHFLHEGPNGGGYWMTADDAEELLTRDKPSSDGAVPSGNSVEAMNLLRLAELTQDDTYRTKAERLFAAFSSSITRRGPGVTRMLAALDRYTDTAREIVIVFDDDAARDRMLQEIRTRFLPNRVLCVVRADQVEAAAAVVPLVEAKVLLPNSHATAYVCERGRCERPTSDPAEFGRQIAAVRPYDPPPRPL